MFSNVALDGEQALCMLAIFLAACVRGYAGFGFSAISISLISLWRSPSAIVPVIFILEIPASLLLLREALRAYSPTWMRPLIGGSVIGIPLGVGLLASLQGPWLQLVVSGCVFAAAGAVRLGWHPRVGDTPGLRWFTGLVSGVLNGIAALGGIACAVMLASVTITPQALRATLTLLFLFTDAYGLALTWYAGLVSPEVVGTALVWLLPLVLGISVGSRFFHQSDDRLFRTRVFTLLLALGALGIVKALWGLR